MALTSDTAFHVGCTTQGSDSFSVKDQIVNVLGFGACVVCSAMFLVLVVITLLLFLFHNL
jgi:hypothetical protein